MPASVASGKVAFTVWPSTLYLGLTNVRSIRSSPDRMVTRASSVGKLGALRKGNGKASEGLIVIGLELPGQACLLAAQDIASGIGVGLCGELLRTSRAQAGAGPRTAPQPKAQAGKGTGNNQTTQGRAGAAKCCVHGFSHDKTPYAPARQSTREYAQRPLPP